MTNPNIPENPDVLNVIENSTVPDVLEGNQNLPETFTGNNEAAIDEIYEDSPIVLDSANDARESNSPINSITGDSAPLLDSVSNENANFNDERLNSSNESAIDETVGVNLAEVDASDEDSFQDSETNSETTEVLLLNESIDAQQLKEIQNYNDYAITSSNFNEANDNLLENSTTCSNDSNYSSEIYSDAITDSLNSDSAINSPSNNFRPEHEKSQVLIDRYKNSEQKNIHNNHSHHLSQGTHSSSKSYLAIESKNYENSDNNRNTNHDQSNFTRSRNYGHFNSLNRSHSNISSGTETEYRNTITESEAESMTSDACSHSHKRTSISSPKKFNIELRCKAKADVKEVFRSESSILLAKLNNIYDCGVANAKSQEDYQICIRSLNMPTRYEEELCQLTNNDFISIKKFESSIKATGSKVCSNIKKTFSRRPINHIRAKKIRTISSVNTSGDSISKLNYFLVLVPLVLLLSALFTVYYFKILRGNKSKKHYPLDLIGGPIIPMDSPPAYEDLLIEIDSINGDSNEEALKVEDFK